MAGLKADRELRLRTLSSIGIVILIISSIYSGGFIWDAVASLIALASLSEYYRLIGKRKGTRLSPGIGYIFSLIVLIAAIKGSRPILIALILSLGVYAIFFIEIFRKQLLKESYAVNNSGGIISGVLFVAVPWICMILLRDYAFGRQVLITLFVCTWSCDVAAYLGGKMFGKAKMCIHVSPGKTWSGFVAGVIGSLVANALAIYFFRLPTYPLIYIGFICGIAGQIGDLSESLIKREMGEKDSGHVIPGHGGILDRFDSILINGLLTYLILEVLL